MTTISVSKRGVLCRKKNYNYRFQTEPPLKPPDHGVISVDKDSPSDISLTLHLEANAESFNKTDTVKGKEAIDLINNLQKEGKDKI